jgi:hypothetical protein
MSRRKRNREKTTRFGPRRVLLFCKEPLHNVPPRAFNNQCTPLRLLPQVDNQELGYHRLEAKSRNWIFRTPSSKRWRLQHKQVSLPTRKMRKCSASTTSSSTKRRCWKSEEPTPKTRRVHTNTASITKDGRTRESKFRFY